MLKERGFPGLAQNYTSYYLSAWGYFLSDYSDTEAGRSAIVAASRVLAYSAELGRQWLEANS